MPTCNILRHCDRGYQIKLRNMKYGAVYGLLSLAFCFKSFHAIKSRSTGERVDIHEASVKIAQAYRNRLLDLSHPAISDYDFTEKERVSLNYSLYDDEDQENLVKSITNDLMRRFSDEIYEMFKDNTLWNAQDDPAINSVKESIKWSEMYGHDNFNVRIYLKDYYNGSPELNEQRTKSIRRLSNRMAEDTILDPSDLERLLSDYLSFWISSYCLRKQAIIEDLLNHKAASSLGATDWVNIIIGTFQDYGELSGVERVPYERPPLRKKLHVQLQTVDPFFANMPCNFGDLEVEPSGRPSALVAENDADS